METNKKLIEGGMEIMKSLTLAIQDAGGRSEMILEGLKNITAYEFMGRLATNNIRFIHIGKELK